MLFTRYYRHLWQLIFGFIPHIFPQLSEDVQFLSPTM